MMLNYPYSHDPSPITAEYNTFVLDNTILMRVRYSYAHH